MVGVAVAGALGLFPSLPEVPALRPVQGAEAPVAVAPPPPAAPVVAPAPTPPPERFQAVTAQLQRNQNLAQALGKLDVPAADVNGIVEALAGIFPFNHAHPGDQLRIERREGEQAVQRFGYRQGPADEWLVVRQPDGTLHGQKREVTLTTEIARVEVQIEGSLWASMERSGQDPDLAVLASDVLAWDVDFYRDVRPGDRLRVVAERVMVDGEPLRYGTVLAAEYEGGATGTKKLFRYTDPKGQTSYYDEDGQSARRGFLKSPLKLARITSRFGNRIHPLLGYQKAHEGVDYGAPVGTPIWAVGDGVVTLAGTNGGCGKQVTIRHRNGYETIYCHLSSIAVSAGKAVSQKQVIGAVGQTGLATGPHLHYAVKKAGGYVNPLTLQVPRDAPLPAQFMDDYRAKIAPLRAQLAGEPVAVN
jgi:murein DD-endopeptidase MepM/ murein hydrolase activator NlpD